jgi:hypothetical protein
VYIGTSYVLFQESALTYATSAWGYAANTHFNKIQIFQNKVLGIITELPWTMLIEILHKRSGTDNLKRHINKAAYELQFKTRLGDKKQIRHVGQFNPIYFFKTKIM